MKNRSKLWSAISAGGDTSALAILWFIFGGTGAGVLFYNSYKCPLFIAFIVGIVVGLLPAIAATIEFLVRTVLLSIGSCYNHLHAHFNQSKEKATLGVSEKALTSLFEGVVDRSKIEMFPAKVLDIKSVIVEFFRDQLGRELKETETMQIVKSRKDSDGEVLALVRFQQVVKTTNSLGASCDKVQTVFVGLELQHHDHLEYTETRFMVAFKGMPGVKVEDMWKPMQQYLPAPTNHTEDTDSQVMNNGVHIRKPCVIN